MICSFQRSNVSFFALLHKWVAVFLADLLNTAKGVSGYHEPEPEMIGNFLKLTNLAALNDSYEQRRFKADAIKKTISELPPGKIYAETNSNFIRTFYDVILKEFPNAEIDIIILRRYLPEVLKGLLELGYFSGNPESDSWIPSVTSKTSLFTPPIAPKSMDAYDRLITFILDNEFRGADFVRKYKDSANIYSIVEVRLEDITSMDGVLHFFKQLRLEVTQETESFVLEQKKLNRKSPLKNKYNVKTSFEACQARLDKYLSICKAKALPLPPLPYLERKSVTI